MAKKVILKDDNVEIMPITRGELVLDSSGQLAFHSSQFLATQSLPGLMSGEDKTKLDSLEKVIVEDKKVEQVNTTTDNSYRLLFSNSADDTTKTEGTRKSAKLLFNPSTGALTATALIGKLDWSNLNNIPEEFTPTQHIHNTNEITALTNYSKASSASDLVTTDTLNAALGKLEYKADTAYDWIVSVTTADTDKYINKWQEIIDFLNAIDNTDGADITDEFVTRKTGQTITGVKTFSTLLKFIVALGTSPFTVTSTTKVDNLNADLLDGLHGSWYLKNAVSFKLTKGVAENQGYDVNTLTEGMVYNYGSADYWKNGPSGMSYGLVLNLKNGSSNSLSGQLAWDVSHNNTTDTTRSLWWRASDNGTFTNAQWHKIAFLESIPNVTDYYWANIPISPESNDATTPQVLYLYATNGINTSYIRSNNSMSISSAYNITLSANDSSVIKIADTFINPLKDDTVNLGTPYDRWSAIYTKSLTTESLNYRCKGSNEYPTMYFFNDTWTYLGFFGMNSEKKFVIADQSGYSSNYVLHSGNSSVSGGGSSWGSSITVNIGGTSKTLTIPANPNTDSNVKLSETTTSSYRPVILGYTSSSTAGSGMTTTTTNVVYASNKFYALPSTGNLYATLFNGILNTASNLYYAESKYGILMNNSDIIGINAIYFGDAADSAGEGINFYRSSTTWDTLTAAGGILYFSANIATATHTLTPVFSALSNSGNNISITIGGLNRTLTPAYASSAGNADTVDGVHASSLSQIKYIGDTSDFCYDVILLCKRDVAHSARLDGLLFTTGGGVCRYHCADAHFWHSCWSVGSYDTQKSISNKGYDGYGFEFCTCTYGGAVWYAIKLNRIQAVSYYFMGNWDNINWTLITYYHTSQGVKNSEIYNSISNLTSTPLRYSGSIYAHHFYESSDRLLKTNIVDINSSDNIPQLKEFDWKEDGSHSYGLIAQELEEQGYPELVSGELDGTKTVNYSAALSLIVGKLQVKIKELEKEIEILKNKN